MHWSRSCCSDAAVKASFLKKSSKLQKCETFESSQQDEDKGVFVADPRSDNDFGSAETNAEYEN